MSEDTELENVGAQETVASQVPEFVLVHSMVRRQATRLQRYRAAEHHSLKQYVMGGKRLIRKRAIKVTWLKMLEHLPELADKTKKGLLEVRTVGGQRVNLEALLGLSEGIGPKLLVLPEDVIEPVPVAPPLPHPPLDSAANDTPGGLPIPHFMGGVGPNDPAAQEAAERLAAEKAEEVSRKVGEPEEVALEPAAAPSATEQELEGLLAEGSEEPSQGPVDAPEAEAPEKASEEPAKETKAPAHGKHTGKKKGPH